MGYSKLGCSNALLQCMLPYQSIAGSCTGGTDSCQAVWLENERQSGKRQDTQCGSASLLPNLCLLLLVPAPTLVTSLKRTEEKVSAASRIWLE